MMEGTDIKQKGGCLLTGTAYIICAILGVLIHVWTILIAFYVDGILSAGITLIFPVVAEIYWGIKIWAGTGLFWNYYTMALTIYIGIYLLIIVGIHLLEDR